MSLFRRYEEELGLAPGVLNATMFGSPGWQPELVGRKPVDQFWPEIDPARPLAVAG